MTHANGAIAPRSTPAEYRAADSVATLSRLHSSNVEDAPMRSARSEIRARAARTRFFKASLFSDPAWDILLELYAAEQEGRRVAVSTVGLGADIPQTTALRWISALSNEGLVNRADDPLDARRTFLSLSDSGLRAMTLYFQNCTLAAGRP